MQINSREDYRRALERLDSLRGQGAMAESNEELAELEGAIARYTAKPGEPGTRKGRPRGGGTGM